MTTKKTSTKKTATKRAAKKPSAKRATKKPSAKPVATKATKQAATQPAKRKPGALDSAVRVLAETKQPMSARELIEAMATKGYWASPAGKTPHATLFAAMIREIATKGKEARFMKVDRGRFALAK